ncbi:MAG: sigma-70 family RNA polymerase sigma factor [Myxococcales bacterium]|nr:sigma-70 family RNA polymerase sigma factor [Myxococcales bacterium]MDD9968645.1 sigma-70 family RNA polymerase sigma factor [Myxococcales bacterium]
MKTAPQEATSQNGGVNGPAVAASKSAEEVDRAHEERNLVKRLQNGDQSAYRALFDRYNRRAFAVAFGVLKNPEDAGDVVQDAFIKVHKHIGNFQGNSSFYTWLYRIVMNLAIDHLRKRRKTTDFDDGIARDDAAGDGALMPKIADASPGRNVQRRELTDHIQQALEQLPEYHRAVIVLREIDGLSYEEMAEVLEVPKGTIMSRLFHARKKMQEMLSGYIDGDFDIED